MQGLPFSFMSRFREVFRDKPCPRVGFGVGVGVGVGFGFGVGVGFGGRDWDRGWDWDIRVWVWDQSRFGVRFRFRVWVRCWGLPRYRSLDTGPGPGIVPVPFQLGLHSVLPVPGSVP